MEGNNEIRENGDDGYCNTVDNEIYEPCTQYNQDERDEYLYEIQNELISLRIENETLKRQLKLKDNTIKELEKYLMMLDDSVEENNSDGIDANAIDANVDATETENHEEENTGSVTIELGEMNNSDAVAKYYYKNKDKIFRNLRNVMIKKGIYRNPRIPDNILNTYTFHLYESLPNEEKQSYVK
jgi:hypothetical protein